MTGPDQTRKSAAWLLIPPACRCPWRWNPDQQAWVRPDAATCEVHRPEQNLIRDTR